MNWYNISKLWRIWFFQFVIPQPNLLVLAPSLWHLPYSLIPPSPGILYSCQQQKQVASNSHEVHEILLLSSIYYMQEFKATYLVICASMVSSSNLHKIKAKWQKEIMQRRVGKYCVPRVEKAMYHTWDWNMKGNSCMWLQHKIQSIECQNKPHTSPSAKSCPLDFTGLPKALKSHLTSYVRQAQPGLNFYDWCSCKMWLVNETYCRTPPWLNAVNLN